MPLRLPDSPSTRSRKRCRSGSRNTGRAAPTGALARTKCERSLGTTGAEVEFLALALGVIIVGVAIVLFRNHRPRGLNSGIDDFAARRDALAPDGSPRT